MTKPAKSTSLAELGYKIAQAHGKDANGNEIVFKVTGPTPSYYIRKTKKGRLVAVKDKDSKIESTIEGLYNFQEKDGDLIGQRATPTPITQKKTQTPTSTAAA